jgi:hypothetical protein
VLPPLGATLMSCFVVAVAPAYAHGPAWAISSASSPTDFAPGDETGDDVYVLTVVNAGDEAAMGSRVEIADTLPSGLAANSISGRDLGNAQSLSCSLTPTLGCSYEGFQIAPGDVLQIQITVKVSSSAASSVVNSATVSGGGAESGMSIEDPTTISATPAVFGISDFATTWSDTQAGASVNLTTGFTLNQVVSGGRVIPAADAKEAVLNLPPGFVANPNAVPQCSEIEAANDTCPAAAAVGVAFTASPSNAGEAPTQHSSLVYDTIPAPGETGVLVLTLPNGLEVRLRLEIRSNGDYGLRVAANDIPEFDELISMTLTLWGVPGTYNGSGVPPARFLTNAGTCTATPPASTLSVDSWTAPAAFVEASSTAPQSTGCNALSFDPSLSVVPNIDEANEPSGYELDLQLPPSEEPEGLASAELEEAAVTLPEGVGISLSAADRLTACSEAQVELGSPTAVQCPSASRIGEFQVRTPLLASPLQGSVFLASPSADPLAAPFVLYFVAEGFGVSIKLGGQLESNPLTGQLTMAMRELPRLPISDWKLRFYGGPNALLATPSSCGAYTTTSELTPWSGESSASRSSSFDITSGANGTPCSASQSFGPTFQAASTTNQAGAYDSLTLLVSRADQEEALGTIAIQAPPAVAEMLAGIPPCGEPQAAQGTCSTASEIGAVTAEAGSGPDPSHLSGAVYLTGPYRGSSQGLSIVLPVDPGPFELGTVVVRATEQIDAGTGRMDIVVDPLPTIVDGIRLRLKTFVLQLDRGEFRPKPDGCEPLTVTGTITSVGGSAVAVSTDPLGQAQCNPPRVPPPASTATLRLARTRITTTKGEATVELTCTGTVACGGKLTLTVKAKTRKGRKSRSATTTIATADFSVPPGKTTDIKLKLDARGRALLRTDRGLLDATLTVLKSSPAPSQTSTDRVRLVQKKVAKARKVRK